MQIIKYQSHVTGCVISCHAEATRRHFRNYQMIYQIQCLIAHSGCVQYNAPQYIGSLQSQFLNLSKLQLVFLTSYNALSNQPNFHLNLFYQKINLQTHKLYQKRSEKPTLHLCR